MIDLPRLLVLTDRHHLHRRRKLVDVVSDCLAHGLTHVVLREFDLGVTDRARLAEQLTEAGATVIAARRPLPLCVGVHLSATGVPVEGPWGRSCHSVADVRHAEAEGAGWVMLSPFAESHSKRMRQRPLPASAFTGHHVPVFALGGIDANNASDAIAAGAHGIAVMGAVMGARRPGRVVRKLLEAVA
jgi:thiamine-phosphate pyrophosphorylase